MADDFEVASGDSSLQVGGRLQARFQYAAIDGFGSQDDEINIAVERARLMLSGQTSDRAHFSMQADFGRGTAALKDFSADLNAGQIWIKMGQFKKPFSRSIKTSTAHLQFLERAEADHFFESGRDVGVSVHNTDNDRHEVAIGLFNGSGENTVPRALSPLLTARAAINNKPFDAYREGDHERGGLRVGVGAGLSYNLDIPNDGLSRDLTATVDMVMKVAGFSTTGAFYTDHISTDDPLDRWGGYIQAGYMVRPYWEPSLRAATIELIDEAPAREVGIANNIFINGDALKWSTDLIYKMGTGLESDNPNPSDMVLRSQMQFIF